MTIQRIGVLFSSVTFFIIYVAFFLLPEDNFTRIFLILVSILLSIIVNWPALMYGRTSNMQIFFDSECMRIRYKNGKILRTVYYIDIKEIQIKEIYGFFYRNNNIKSKYICVFLNEKTEIPTVPFKKLFYQENLVILNYTPSVFCFIVQKFKTSRSEWL